MCCIPARRDFTCVEAGVRVIIIPIITAFVIILNAVATPWEGTVLSTRVGDHIAVIKLIIALLIGGHVDQAVATADRGTVNVAVYRLSARVTGLSCRGVDDPITA